MTLHARLKNTLFAKPNIKKRAPRISFVEFAEKVGVSAPALGAAFKNHAGPAPVLSSRGHRRTNYYDEKELSAWWAELCLKKEKEKERLK